MKLQKLVIAALTFASAGAIAAANSTSANTAPSSNQGYAPSSQDIGSSLAPQSSSQGDNSQLTQIQQALNGMGLNAGPVDGKMGPKTKSALRQFQQQHGLQASGQLDAQTVAMLNSGTSSSGAPSNTSVQPNTNASPSSAQQGFFSPQGRDASGSTSNSSSGSTAGTTGTNGSTEGSSTPASPQPSGSSGSPQG